MPDDGFAPENDAVVFEDSGKLFHWQADEWEEKITGTIKISKTDDSSKQVLKVLSRTERVILEHDISSDMDRKHQVPKSIGRQKP
ncbi:hypothetical protein BJX96DRAFT_170603 [Aspergillus floccosus]